VSTTQNPIIRVWKWWFTSRSTDPTVVYRERALRVLIPVIFSLRTIATISNYVSTPSTHAPYFAFWISLAAYFIPILLAAIFLVRQEINWAGAFFLLHWYLIDMVNLPVDGYWLPGFQISLIIQVVLSTLLLPSRAILPFLIFQVTTIGLWGGWLDVNYFDPPLLSTGEPVAAFQRTIFTLAAQETIIMFIIRYLRRQMERALRSQQATIVQLEDEIEKRQRLQDEREEHIHELNAKNAELERFTYTVSHDLKSPIVTIKGFVGMLTKDMQENRPDRVLSDIRRIESAADKMNALLLDLLELSRIGRLINPPEEVDTVRLIQDALDNLHAQLRSKNITVNIAPDLPNLYGDRIRLREVFENLISNAAKYIGDQTTPVIEVGVRKHADEQIFHVKDNGIGVDPRYHTRIFNLFEKLNPTIDGTGIGLTIVKRIIEVHGGRVWVESEGLGKGSTFYFTIPDSRNPNGFT